MKRPEDTMHDTVINNAFFALMALGGSTLAVMAVSQVVFPAPALSASASLAQYATMLLLGA